MDVVVPDIGDFADVPVIEVLVEVGQEVAAEDPLIKLWQHQAEPFVNLVITPHTAFYSEAGMVEMRQKAAQEIGRALRGERLLNCVNSECLVRK